MKNTTPLWKIVLALLAAALLFGCANKPKPTPAVAEDKAPAEQVVAADSTDSVETAGFDEAASTDRQPAMAEQDALDKLERIHFAFDRFTLSAAARDTLAANAAYLQTNPGVKVDIEGHCDERGSDEYNLALGQRRAQAARDYLVSLGVPPERLETVSYGEEKPLDSAGGEKAWAENRRAEFTTVR
jgi:peptidoglycan-associated lipoprotein